MLVPYKMNTDSIIVSLLGNLPVGYLLEQIGTAKGETEKFAVFFGSSQVAAVSAEVSGFLFQFSVGSKGDRLESLIAAGHIASNLVWLLVFPSYESKWAYLDAPAKSKDEALANIGLMVMKRGSMLVGFYSSEWLKEDNSLSYVLSYQLRGSAEDPSLCLTDMGSAMIEFTTLESG